MSKLHFLHSGGDKVTLTTPASNPSTNPVFKLPQTDGSAGQVLKTDGNGNLSWVTPASTNGITVADCWHMTSAFTNPNQNGGFIAADWSRASFAQSGNVGASINQYGGTFSFNQTGIYLIDATVGCHITSNGRDRYVAASLHTGTGGHNGSFTMRANSYTNLGAEYSTTHGFVRTSLMMDVTNTGAANTTVDCFRLYTNSENSSTIIKGSSTSLQTYFTVIRLGDT